MHPFDGRSAGVVFVWNHTLSNIISERSPGNDVPVPVQEISDVAVPPLTCSMHRSWKMTSCQPYAPKKNPAPAENFTIDVRWPEPWTSNPMPFALTPVGTGIVMVPAMVKTPGASRTRGGAIVPDTFATWAME